MIIVYYKNDPSLGKIIRPTPFISISFSSNRNKLGYIGGEYNITLNGTILSTAGSPIANGDIDTFEQLKSEGPNYDDETNNYSRPAKQIIKLEERAYSIFMKQNAIRSLFAHDGQKMEILPIDGDYPIATLFPSLQSIDFEEGKYTDLCKYTINLTAPVIYDKNNNPFKESTPTLTFEGKNNFLGNRSREYIDNSNRGYIENFTDNWSIEVDENYFGYTPKNINLHNKGAIFPVERNVPRFYRVTRNISVTGKNMYIEEKGSYTTKRYEAWEMAKNFAKKELLKETSNTLDKQTFSYFPGYADNKVFGSGLLNIPSGYIGYNHVRTENIDKTGGVFSLSDTWILASGNNNTIESYDLSINSSVDSPFVSVNINGKIKGLSDNHASNYYDKKTYNKAIQEYNRLSNNGFFGIGSNIFKRASNITPIILNPSPLSVSLNTNEQTGEIDYSISFNNRPITFFNNVSQENITVTDTYPGDIYALIPVLNRKEQNGPIIQYFGGRTEYKRSLSVELFGPYGFNGSVKLNNKSVLIYKKPSCNELFNTKLKELIKIYSPEYEPGIRKYFVDPITESWDPKTGKYTVNISWIYELNI